MINSPEKNNRKTSVSKFDKYDPFLNNPRVKELIETSKYDGDKRKSNNKFDMIKSQFQEKRSKAYSSHENDFYTYNGITTPLNKNYDVFGKKSNFFILFY